MSQSVNLPADSTIAAPKPPVPDDMNKAGDAQPNNGRPAWLPEKFQTPEAMAAAYAELERKQGAGKDAASVTPKEGGPKGEAPKAEGKAGDTSKPPTPLQPFFDEFAKDGKLSEESFDGLQKLGIPREVVQEFIENRAAREELAKRTANETSQTIFKAVGGEEAYRSLQTWAGENLTDAEAAAFNKSVSEGSVEERLFAVRGLMARFEASNGRPAKLLHGNKAATTNAGFASSEEMVRAMQDPRYTADPAYRAEVRDRLKATTAF